MPAKLLMLIGKHMKEIKGDLWQLPGFNKIFITTNGYVNKQGKAVMGRGCALEAKTKMPGVERVLGKSIVKYGNHVLIFAIYEGKDILSFPVKHNWWEKADIELIKRSCTELMQRLDPWHKVLLPRPGCGNGHLNWENVKPVIAPLLNDQVYIVSK